MNVTAISFSISTIFCAAICWQTFKVFKKQKENPSTEAFFQSLLCFVFYMGVRALVSTFFTGEPLILTSIYILSHVFLGMAAAFLAKFAVLSFFNLRRADKIFIIACLFFATDVIFNIFFPNQPRFNAGLNIIEWGTQKYVGIYHTLLLWAVFLSVAGLFIYKAVKNWQDREIRLRSLTISSGVILSIIVVIPRNIFHSPVFIMISDIGYVFAFGLILWAIARKMK